MTLGVPYYAAASAICGSSFGGTNEAASKWRTPLHAPPPARRLICGRHGCRQHLQAVAQTNFDNGHFFSRHGVPIPRQSSCHG